MKTTVWAAIACLLVLVPMSSADDLNPPPWRGQPGTTSQVWAFSTPQSTGLFPDGPAAGGLPPIGQTQVLVVPHPTEGWLATDMGHTGVWPLSGEMYFLIENYPIPNPVKYVQMQITWRPQDLSGSSGIPVVEFLNPLAVSFSWAPEIPLDTPWVHTTYTWEYLPNPAFEEFRLYGDINVDQIVIDTWCTVPEPATAALLGLGTLLFLRRRRSR